MTKQTIIISNPQHCFWHAKKNKKIMCKISSFKTSQKTKQNWKTKTEKINRRKNKRL